MDAMRLVFTIDSLNGGGAEKVIVELALALRELGHDAILVCMMKRLVYELPDNLPTYFLHEQEKVKLYKSKDRAKHISLFNALIKSIEEQRGPVNHIFSNLDDTHYILSGAQPEKTSFIMHCAVAESMKRAMRMGPVKYLRTKKLFLSFSRQNLITVSEGLRKEVQGLNWFHPKSISCIYNPFNIEKIKSMSEEQPDNLPQQDYLIHIGRYARQKRHDILFDALRQTRTPIKLVCLCNDNNKLLKLARKYGVEHRIIAPGFQQNPFPWIRNAKCMVLSSDYEGLPTVIIEALLCSTPVVSTDCNHGPAELLEGIQASRLVPRRSPKALAQALDEVLCKPVKVKVDKSKFDHLSVARQYLTHVEQQHKGKGKP